MNQPHEIWGSKVICQRLLKSGKGLPVCTFGGLISRPWHWRHDPGGLVLLPSKLPSESLGILVLGQEEH